MRYRVYNGKPFDFEKKSVWQEYAMWRGEALHDSGRIKIEDTMIVKAANLETVDGLELRLLQCLFVGFCKGKDYEVENLRKVFYEKFIPLYLSLPLL